MQLKENFLTRNQKDLLKARHRHERDKRLCDRIKSILLLDEGWTYPQLAHALLLDEDTIRRYYKTYLEGGKEALLNLNYAGSESYSLRYF
ncbi:helix-turn-helix domain-containing protein [Candidatus Rhabdochlamydia oedothoracis]|nr:helix-turn-helix domain-containing protein [Candidatus Rhabdochlamydia oedothoracis]